MIRFIAALDSKNGIADDHGIPWQGKLPTDVQYFRRKTLHGIVIMGYGWYKEQKVPLPDRRNLVATSHQEVLRDGFEKIIDANKFLSTTQEDIWVGGGAGLFASTLLQADELYLTRIEADFHCNKFFPDFTSQFNLVKSSVPKTENDLTFHYEVWIKSAQLVS